MHHALVAVQLPEHSGLLQVPDAVLPRIWPENLYVVLNTTMVPRVAPLRATDPLILLPEMMPLLTSMLHLHVRMQGPVATADHEPLLLTAGLASRGPAWAALRGGRFTAFEREQPVQLGDVVVSWVAPG